MAICVCVDTPISRASGGLPRYVPCFFLTFDPQLSSCLIFLA